jgi:putative FmdB family regulatory protein
MPIYEYNCEKCGQHMEVLIRNKSDVPGKCPACGSTRLAKAFSSFAVSSPTKDVFSSCSECPTAGGTCDAGPCAGGSCPYGG